MNRLVALAAAIGVSVVSGQWLEETIWLPDSLGGLARPICATWDSLDNEVYLAGWMGDNVVVVDVETNQRVARIWHGHRVRDICYNARFGKMYCSNGAGFFCSDSTVTVIDCIGDTVIGVLVVGQVPQSLCVSRDCKKVYCTTVYSDNLVVIDAASDSVVAKLELGGEPRAVWAHPFLDKVYCTMGDDDQVVVVDATCDSIIARLEVGNGPSFMCYSPPRNKLYVSNCYGGTMTVVDCPTDSVLADVQVGVYPRDVCYCSQADRVYCVNRYSRSISVIDCATDSVIANIGTRYEPRAIACPPAEQQGLLHQRRGPEGQGRRRNREPDRGLD